MHFGCPRKVPSRFCPDNLGVNFHTQQYRIQGPGNGTYLPPQAPVRASPSHPGGVFGACSPVTGTDCGPRRGRAFCFHGDRRCDRSYPFVRPQDALKSASREFGVPPGRRGGGGVCLSGLSAGNERLGAKTPGSTAGDQVIFSNPAKQAIKPPLARPDDKLRGPEKRQRGPPPGFHHRRHVGLPSLGLLGTFVSFGCIVPPFAISLVPLPSRPGPGQPSLLLCLSGPFV